MLLHYLVKFKTPKNVILQRDITEENCIRCITASSVDQGHQVPYIYLFGVLYSKACMKQRFTISTTCKNAWCKLVLTLTGTSSMLAWPSEIMCACWWWTLWMHVQSVNHQMFIYMIHQYILWNCQCNLTHVTAIFYLTLKAEVVFTCIFGFSTFTRQCSNIN